MNNTDIIALAFLSLFYLCLGLLALLLFAEFCNKLCQLASYIIGRLKGEDCTADWDFILTEFD